ncbi:MAG: response regulator transcription factor [Gallionella sp.]
MKVLLADDQALFRAGIASMLRSQYESLEVVEAAVFMKALKQVKLSPAFDLAILDMQIAGGDDVLSVKVFHHRYPHIPILVTSEKEDRAVMERAMEYGAMGFICKSADETELLKAVALVLHGDLYITNKTLRRNRVTTTAEVAPPPDRRRQNTNQYGLTERQMQILQNLAAGLSNREIATELGLAEGTVKVHVAAAYQMLRVNSRSEAVHVAAQLGLIGAANG